MGTEIGGNVESGRDFTGRDWRTDQNSGNSTNIYLERLRERGRQDRAASEDEIDRLVLQLSDRLDDLARVVVDLRLEMVKLRIEINQLKEAEANRFHLKDWHIGLVVIAAIAVTVMVAISLYLMIKA